MFKNKLMLTLCAILSLVLTSQAIATITAYNSYMYVHPGNTVQINLADSVRSDSPILTASIVNTNGLEGELEYASNDTMTCDYSAPANPSTSTTQFQYVAQNAAGETSNPATLQIIFGGIEN